MKRTRHLISILQTILVTTYAFSSTAFTADAPTSTTEWGYTGKTGPAYWGKLDPKFELCLIGKTQSPINIPRNTTQTSNDLTIDYKPSPMIVMQDGTTDLTIGNTQTIFNEGHTLQLNFPNTDEIITLQNKTFHLVQFHFHIPSENKLQGQAFPVEIHFVHQGENGQVAVIGVFAKFGKENAALQKIINNIPKEKGAPETIQGESINPIDLLPKQRSHYRFAGSLTTPPCSEGIEWVVMQTPISLSPSQFSSLKKATGINARPTQAINNRTVDSIKQ